jgi:hypothetical protein
MVIRLVLST